MKQPRQTYDQRVALFTKVCDLSVFIISKANISEEEKNRLTREFKSSKNMALNPGPEYKKIASLKYIEAELFWYWNEKHGDHVNEFWESLADTGFNYKRKDILIEALKKERISNRIQYDYVIDEMLVVLQKAIITQNDYTKLNELLLNYENSLGRKKISTK